MDIPDFSEFINTLSVDKMAEFYGPPALNIYKIENVNPETLSMLIQQIFNEAMICSSKYSLHLLQTYHDWLSEQLS